MVNNTNLEKALNFQVYHAAQHNDRSTLKTALWQYQWQLQTIWE